MKTKVIDLVECLVSKYCVELCWQQLCSCERECLQERLVILDRRENEPIAIQYSML